MKNSIDIYLDGSEDELSALFSYSEELKNSGLTTLPDYIAHVFNQTLSRDNYFGAWAIVLEEDGKYLLKLSSPHHNLNVYKNLIESYLKAGKVALDFYLENKEDMDKAGLHFLLPFGLAMSTTKSVQLLHYPPMETFAYLDYLYSPTNRRWENLLLYNDISGLHLPSLETIVDCVPLAAPGGDSSGIDPYNNSFTSYVKQMLQARLNPHGVRTQPVVGYGGPVRGWLEQAYADQISEDLKVLSLIELKIFEDGPTTPVLCANHPSMYLYYTSKENSDQKTEILTQDLIAAGWQAKMAKHPHLDPNKVLDAEKAYWTDNPEVMRVMKQEDSEFSFKP